MELAANLPTFYFFLLQAILVLPFLPHSISLFLSPMITSGNLSSSLWLLTLSWSVFSSTSLPFHFNFLVAWYATLHPSLSVRRSVGRSVCHNFFVCFCGLWPYWTWPNAMVTSITAPAHPNKTRLAVNLALFVFFTWSFFCSSLNGLKWIWLEYIHKIAAMTNSKSRPFTTLIPWCNHRQLLDYPIVACRGAGVGIYKIADLMQWIRTPPWTTYVICDKLNDGRTDGQVCTRQSLELCFFQV